MMKINSQTAPKTPAETPGVSNPGSRLTPELVRQVADKVYAMLIKELGIENERCRFEGKDRNNLMGGCGWNR
jgi:hypothetical protein